MAAVYLGQVFGSSLPVSAASGYYSPLSHVQHRSSSGQTVDPHSWEEAQPLHFRSTSLPSVQNSLHTPFESAEWVPHTGDNLKRKEADACLAHNKTPEQVDSSCQTLHVHSPEQSKAQKTVEQPQPQKTAGSTKRKSIDSPSDKKRQTILIWDLDETLILFHSLLSGQYADSHSPERAKEASKLGRKWQESILDMCDQHFFFTEIENYDQTTTGALAQWDDHQSLADYDFSSDNLEAPENDDERRKLAYRFRRISQLYSQGVRPLARDMLELQNWNWLYNATDKLTKGWLTHGARLLQQVIASAKSSEEAMQSAASTGSSRSGSGSWQSACGDAFGHSMMDQQLHRLMGRTSGAGSGQLSTSDTADVVNVLVTTGQLVPTLGKLLLFKLDGAFKATSVYSARNEGKSHCFDLIRERFGDDCNFVAIGDGAEEQKCAQQRGWPFVKVSLQSQAEKTAKVVGQTIAAFPTEGGLLTNMHAEHLTSLFPEA